MKRPAPVQYGGESPAQGLAGWAPCVPLWLLDLCELRGDAAATPSGWRLSGLGQLNYRQWRECLAGVLLLQEFVVAGRLRGHGTGWQLELSETEVVAAQLVPSRLAPSLWVQRLWAGLDHIRLAARCGGEWRSWPLLLERVQAQGRWRLSLSHEAVCALLPGRYAGQMVSNPCFELRGALRYDLSPGDVGVLRALTQGLRRQQMAVPVPADLESAQRFAQKLRLHGAQAQVAAPRDLDPDQHEVQLVGVLPAWACSPAPILSELWARATGDWVWRQRQRVLVECWGLEVTRELFAAAQPVIASQLAFDLRFPLAEGTFVTVAEAFWFWWCGAAGEELPGPEPGTVFALDRLPGWLDEFSRRQDAVAAALSRGGGGLRRWGEAAPFSASEVATAPQPRAERPLRHQPGYAQAVESYVEQLDPRSRQLMEQIRGRMTPQRFLVHMESRIAKAISENPALMPSSP